MNAGGLASSLLNLVVKSAPSSARHARRLGVLQSRSSRELVQFCDLVGPALASSLLTAPQLSAECSSGFDLTCHFHEGARLLRAGSLALLRKAFIVRHFYFGRRRPEW